MVRAVKGRELPVIAEIEDDRLYVTPYDVAKLLSISRTQTYDLLAKGLIPGRRVIGKRIRVHLPTLIEWAKNGTGVSP